MRISRYGLMSRERSLSRLHNVPDLLGEFLAQNERHFDVSPVHVILRISMYWCGEDECISVLIRRPSVQSISTFGNVRNNSVTSQHAASKYHRVDSTESFNLHFFLALPACFARLLVTQRQRQHCRSVVDDAMENGGEMCAQVRFYFQYTRQFCLFSLAFVHLHFTI